ncbi:Transcriptional regulatory protein sin3 [Geranomyces variabilis]|uniref:Transcriptional regulatory protein sin3 n=1 Tax=Geranomyces variabilis TaxID=109894 RepID=A0AAD5TP50_9FUNG|nr:Transcriptional regulatory protein sin3 [Geranomyces variabilis]
MSNTGDQHHWPPPQHATSGHGGIPPPTASQGSQMSTIHMPAPAQQHQQQTSQPPLGTVLASLQQSDLPPQGQAMQSHPYQFGAGSGHPPLSPATASSPYGQVLSLADRMSTGHDLGAVPSGPPPPPPPPPLATSALGQSAVAPGSASSLGPELTSAESQVIGASQGYRPLNVKDALSYLDQVKIRFNDQPEVYNRFLDIMKDFKSQALDTPGVIRRVSNLFREHPELISGFNTFLPPGYKIEPGINGEVKVTTPRDAPPYHDSTSGLQSLGEGATSVSNGTAILGNSATPLPNYFGSSGSPYGAAMPGNLPISSLPSHASAGNAAGVSQPYNAAIASASNIISSMQSHGSGGSQPLGGRKGSTDGDTRRAPVEFNHAINYVNKIKNRFSSEPETYKQFLEILQTYQKEQKPIQEVYAQVQVLFKGAPDLLDEFKQFLPDNSNNGQNQGPLSAFGRAGGLPVLSTINGMAVPQVQPAGNQKSAPPTSANANKKNQKRPAASSAGGSSGPPPAQIPVPPPKKRARMGRSEKPGTIEELEFFDKCKKIINNKTTYNEFLKILNLFSQEIIEAKVLVERVEPFLSRAPDLFEWFKRFVKYEDDEVIYNIPAERPEINVNTLRRLGHSYRQLPAEIPRPKCSGRDALCNEVLNDEWISHPVYVSETGFVSHKKTQFEEALHKCEEERYEFDMNIESNLHAIGLLKPIAVQISNMSAEEKNRLKFPHGLGGPGTSKTIYQRVIKKVYDKERGAEILDALHHSPAVAVPVVLKRLIQKDEEWKRAQRDWNKVWREIDTKNYYKALDHQGIHFKATDKKIMSAKSLIQEIEAIHAERRDGFSGRPNRYQFDFSFKDQEVFKDVRALLRVQAQSSPELDKKVIRLLSTFTKRLFHLGNEDADSEEEEGSDMDGDDDDSAGPERVRAGGKGGRNSLRRDVLTRQTTGVTNGGGGTRTESGEAVLLDTDEEQDRDSIADPRDETDAAPSGDEDLDLMDLDAADDSHDNSEAGGEPRGTYVMYANNLFYVFLRQYQLLYSRLMKMKELSSKIAHDPPKTGSKSHIAKELGLQNDSLATYAKLDRYTELLQACASFLSGDTEASEFEEKARTMFGTSAYLVFTVDKLCQAIIKQAQSAVADSKSMSLLEMYYKDRVKRFTSARQEAMYRINTETVVQDDNIYRLEYFVDEKVLTVQLLSKEENMSDGSVSREDRWTLYVDHFVQLNATENLRASRREPFLKRNLPASAPDQPPHDVEAHSGLELKVCVNTYKMFFVDHTEDYFVRRRRRGAAAEKEEEEEEEEEEEFANDEYGAAEAAARKRWQQFSAWVESERGGWKRGVSASEQQRLAASFEKWMKGGDGGDGGASKDDTAAAAAAGSRVVIISPLIKRTVDGVTRWESEGAQSQSRNVAGFSPAPPTMTTTTTISGSSSSSSTLPPATTSAGPRVGSLGGSGGSSSSSAGGGGGGGGGSAAAVPRRQPLETAQDMEGVELVLPQIDGTANVLGDLGDTLGELATPAFPSTTTTATTATTATGERWRDAAEQ